MPTHEIRLSVTNEMKQLVAEIDVLRGVNGLSGAQAHQLDKKKNRLSNLKIKMVNAQKKENSRQAGKSRYVWITP